MNLRCAGVLQSVEKLRAVTVNRAERRPVSYHFRFFVDDASDFACEIVIKSLGFELRTVWPHPPVRQTA